MGSRGGEDSYGHGGTKTGRVWGERGRQSDHWQTLRPHIHADKPRGQDSEWWRTGQAELRVAAGTNLAGRGMIPLPAPGGIPQNAHNSTT